ncbi:MAG: carboxymuconolactone decarboxylase family protein [Chloroflexota bacterium]
MFEAATHDILTAKQARRCNIARISYIEKNGAPPEVAEIFGKMEANGAPVMNLWKMAAHIPATLPHFIRMGNAILTKTRLDPKLREMVILRTADIMDCEYEHRAHIVLAKELGVTSEKIEAIKDWKSSTAFSKAERAVLRFADEVVKKGRVGDATFGRLAKYLDAGMMVEVAQVAGFYGMIARLLLAFEVDLDKEAPASSTSIVGRR